MTTEAEGVDKVPAGKGSGSTRLASSMVAAGILLSRVAGLIREGFFSLYLGTSAPADVWRAGMKMPNLLQNLLGEGTLSASFIPVYSRLLEEGSEEDAGRVAGAIFGLLLAVAGTVALIGILLAPVLVPIFMPGFVDEKRELAIQVVRIIFPMTAILVVSAWALGILNSHRSFFIPYVAPVIWNAAIIATLVLFGGGMSPERLVIALAWGALLGGALQFLVQLPKVLRLQRGIRPSLNLQLPAVREVLKNAGPAITGRGVVQLSGYVDTVLATLLATGAISFISYAQTIYLLPISLFGMSVAAAELPELSRGAGGTDETLRLRTNAGLERIAFFVIPSFVAFLALGDVAVAALYQRGAFGPPDTLVVYLTLCAFSLGLLASTGTRLFSSTFYALRDTRSPARFAITRVVIAALIGFVLMTQLEPIPLLGIEGGLLSDLSIEGRRLGAVGLGIGSGIAAWVEWALLRRGLRRRIGPVGAGGGKLARMFGCAALAALAGWGVKLVVQDIGPLPGALLVFSAFGAVYLLSAIVLGLSEAGVLRNRIVRMVGRRG